MITLALDSQALAFVQPFERLYPQLKVYGYGISTPEPNFNFVDVPGRNGALDLTAALGQVTFQNRKVWFGCREYANASKHLSLYSDLLNRYHGQRVKFVAKEDPSYYYIGRCTITAEYDNNRIRGFAFEIDADPFKYPVYGSDENWLWDPFNFETGVIRVYNNLQVNGTRTIEVIAYSQPESPKFYVTLASGQSSMRMVYDDQTYYLRNGLNSFPAISISSPDIYTDIHSFTFYGQGTVSINIRGGIL